MRSSVRMRGSAIHRSIKTTSARLCLDIISLPRLGVQLSMRSSKVQGSIMMTGSKVTCDSTVYETSYYTLCDSHPRVITSTPTATLTTTWPPLTTTILVQGISQVKYPVPNCTVSWDDCQGLWSRYYSASSVYNSISFELANTVVQMGPGASYWIVNGVTTTFPTPSPATVSLGTEYIHKYYKSGQYMVVTTPPPGGFICDCGHIMTVGGPPVTIKHTVDFTNTPYTPSCRTEKPTCTANQRCQIDGDRVEIFWFPPQTNVTRDMWYVLECSLQMRCSLTPHLALLHPIVAQSLVDPQLTSLGPP